MRLLTALCITAIVVAFAVPAFAETQNVKISGDIAVASIFDIDLDLRAKGGANTGIDNENDNKNFFMQQVGLNVQADLTDNVSTYLRVINERAWDAETQGAAEYDIDLDEAYLTLKEMLYAPLTVKLGRQNIWLGKGFVIGNAGVNVWDRNAAIPEAYDELSDMTAFDALRATLDYDPWTINLIYSKIDENAADDERNDDVDLYVANVGYKFAKYDAEAEAYFIHKNDRTTNNANTNKIETVGLRGSFVPFDNMNVWAEGALQVGKYVSGTGTAQVRDEREAYALDLGGDYSFTDVRWTPKLGLEYVYWSGEEASRGGDWGAWDALYPGKFDTNIAAFRNITKFTDYDLANPTVANPVATNGNCNGATNESQLGVLGSLNPMTDVKVDARYTYLWFDKVPLADKSDKLGQEIDGKITYDYTEDVTFCVAGGLFSPGSYYPTDFDDTASQVISSVKVEF